MTHILLVKLSSMGDLIQLLPALSDARAQRPELCFDWVADTAFAEIPGWHPAVDRVIVSAHRQWRERKSAFLRHGAREHHDRLSWPDEERHFQQPALLGRNPS